MGLTILENLIDASKLKALDLTKSQSLCEGATLRKAHYELGKITAEHITNCNTSYPSDYGVVILMRAGLNFGLGIADNLEHSKNKVSIYFTTQDGLDQESIDALSRKKIVIVDAVINTGKSISNIINRMEQNQAKNTIIATIVMPEKAQHLAHKLNIISLRVSENKYKGAKIKTVTGGIGPDTGDRLFGTM